MTNGNGGDLGDMSMMDLFRMEAENQCNQLSEDLLALEQDPTAANLLESLMRASHSVKGAARVVELHPAVQVAHTMEDVFVAAQDSKIKLDQEGIDLMLQGVDMLSSISQLSDDDTDSFFAENKDNIAALVSSFTALAKGDKTSTKGPAASTDETPSTPESAPSTPEIESTQLPVDLSDMSMLDLFRMEAENHCTRLSEDLIALENDPASSELLESMMRASHSMKGAARIVELHPAVKLAHAMEDVFVAAQLDKITIERSDIDILLNGVDLLTTIAQTPETEAEKWFAEHTSDIDDLVKKFEGLAKKEKSAKPEPTPEELPQKISVPEPSAPAQKIAEEKPPKQATQKDEKKKQARRMNHLLNPAGCQHLTRNFCA
jgi:two-component system sensor histidine kinase and response regulator WspE